MSTLSDPKKGKNYNSSKEKRNKSIYSDDYNT